MDRLSNRVAIITGGARGMGEATVRLFVEQGANVVIGDVLDEPGQRLADSLGERCRYQHLDVTSEENWTRVVDYAVAEFGRVDVLVNNAGILHIASVRDTTAADYQKVIAVNQVGPFLGIKAVLDVMKGQGATICGDNNVGKGNVRIKGLHEVTRRKNIGDNKCM